MIAVMVAVGLFLLASTSIPILEPHSVAVRVLGAVAVIAPVVWRKGLHEHASFPRFSRAIIGTGVGFGIYLAASKLAHGDVLATLTGLIVFLFVALLAHVLLHYYSTYEITAGAHAAFLLICVASLVAQQVAPEVATENSRLRGVLENANGLGFVAFALGSVSLAGRFGPWQSLLGVGVALSCLFLSGSRASMLALVLVGFGFAIGGIRRARWVMTFGTIAAIATWLLSPGAFADVLLLRTSDTRSVGFDVMQEAMSKSFLIGLGELPEGTRVAGSVFTAGITGGALGLFGLSVMYICLMWGFTPSRPRAFTLVAAGIIHSLFESWILSFSAPMLLTFFIMLAGFVKLDGASHISRSRPRNQARNIPHDRRSHLRTSGSTRFDGEFTRR